MMNDSCGIYRSTSISTRDTPSASSEVVRGRLRAQGQRDTKMELEVRRLLHARGLRFRVDAQLDSRLGSRADIVWKGRKIAVYIDGCFWHGCPVHMTWPKANARWWRDKIEANVERDRRVTSELRALGWTVLRYWEHQRAVDVADDIDSELRKNVKR